MKRHKTLQYVKPRHRVMSQLGLRIILLYWDDLIELGAN